MRPPDLDVTFTLQTLDCFATEDAGEDEPYLWNVGFKVDADTLGPPPPGSLIPSLNVQIFDTPFFAHIAGAGGVRSGQTWGIHPKLGTRAFRLRPALLPLAGWFPGLAGIICLLWDEDGFAPSTAEAGFRKFKQVIGPAMTAELNRLANGDYDNDLAKDLGGVTLPDPPGGRTIQWRFARMADPGGRKNAVKALTRNVKSAVMGPVKSAIVEQAGLDELIDPDDLLGVEAQVHVGNELTLPRPFTLTFTDDDANYAAHGLASGVRTQRTVLDAMVLRTQETLDGVEGIWRRVCWGPNRLYWASAWRVSSVLRFDLRPLVGPPPASVRWFIDDRPLPDGQSALPVTFAPVSKLFGMPGDLLADAYPGGPGMLSCLASGLSLEVGNVAGAGAFLGKVRALYAYPGDPTLFPVPEPAPAELIGRGYDISADLDILTVRLAMNQDYYDDVAACARTVKEIEWKRIPVNWGKARIDPGDPPEWRRLLEEAQSVGRLISESGGIDLAVDAPSALSGLRRMIRPR